MNLSKNSNKLSKLLAIIMTVVMVFGMLPTAAFAALGQVHVVVENTTFTEATPDSNNKEPAWKETLVDEWVDLKSDSTMMDCIVEALTKGGYSQTGAENGYISEINGLAEKEGSPDAGWMGTLNDWFTNMGFNQFSVENGSLVANDEIRVMYTLNGGEDLGGSWDNNDKTVTAVEFSAGTLDKAFDAETKEYTLTVPANVSSVKVTPTAANKNYQVRTYLGTQETGTEYKRTKEIPVKDGDVITVVCGDPEWPSMNNQSTEAREYVGTWYELHIVSASSGGTEVDAQIDALPNPDDLTYENRENYRQDIVQAKKAMDALKDSTVDKERAEKLKKLCDKLAGFDAVDDPAVDRPRGDGLDGRVRGARERDGQSAQHGGNRRV